MTGHGFRENRPHGFSRLGVALGVLGAALCLANFLIGSTVEGWYAATSMLSVIGALGFLWSALVFHRDPGRAPRMQYHFRGSTLSKTLWFLAKYLAVFVMLGFFLPGYLGLTAQAAAAGVFLFGVWVCDWYRYRRLTANEMKEEYAGRVVPLAQRKRNEFAWPPLDEPYRIPSNEEKGIGKIAVVRNR